MELQQLWDEYILNKTSSSKEAIIKYYIFIVKKIANKMAFALPRNIAIDDLYSYGVFGLLDAIERYNPEIGVSFEIFARKRIKGSIIDWLRKEDWIPISLRRKAKLVEQAYKKLELELERSATDEEVATELNIHIDEFSKWLVDIQFITLLSLDETFHDQDETLLKDNIPNINSPNPLSIVEENEIKQILTKTVQELSKNEKLVIYLFYYQELSNKEIAHVMELSESRISQLHTKAVFRMRGKLARYKKIMK
ncbi:MAG: FliA/WhiG family RNA polymerase sigma factor [Clostridia bacterium]|nr:FliA/WhiG family RNA polymerase sigma factor [Clostridia bacterium]MDD4047601.1 FliA/WhiG family RNA polymerase sigma factor [Clostridia bacterium]